MNVINNVTLAPLVGVVILLILRLRVLVNPQWINVVIRGVQPNQTAHFLQNQTKSFFNWFVDFSNQTKPIEQAKLNQTKPIIIGLV